jgi:pullulanase/glycogen debranching enzyme
LLTKDKSDSKLTLKREKYLQKLQDLDKYYSDKKLGSFVENGKTFFRLFAPQAVKVILCTFSRPEDNSGSNYEMAKDADGVWEVVIKNELYGMYYGYKVYKNADEFNKEKEICIDPYAKAAVKYNTYFSPRRSIVVKENNYDWENDNSIQRDWRDLVIYEMHIRDITAHKSSGANRLGTYKGLIEKRITGGIEYIKSLGVNMVELLPAQDFAIIEIPYKKKFSAITSFSKNRFNTWNPYERNHWGYMTSAYFAPESYYCEEELKWNTWQGYSGKQIVEFKDMVKVFHKENIAVIMDVVYNHLSEYESGNLKEIDHEYYFRLDEDENFISKSGCGNDLKTERPMLRKLIVDSIIYWMKEYHIDGFRFDMGKLIDWETIEQVTYEAKKINPNVIFVCEPWGGGYDPEGFSHRGWASWNDQIRNGVKGENPFHGQGWIFGKWYGNNNPARIKSYLNGTLIKDAHGLFQTKEHSVNYLESHDGYTLGDFIRIATKEFNIDKAIEDVDTFVKLTPSQLKLNKLAALFLLTSQGIVMIHSGQEFARTKVISPGIKTDKNIGRIDHNSYNKDNETNYINYNHAKINGNLLEYYKGLIKLRNTFEAFRRTSYKDVNFFEVKGKHFTLGYHLKYKQEEFIVLFNANHLHAEEFHLPAGDWHVLVNPSIAGIKTLDTVNEKIILESSSGCVLKKK